MSRFHTVVWIDHHRAQILQFDAERVDVQKVQTHTHDTRQHGSDVRAEHEFFGEVCDELTSVGKVVVTGSNTALSDFRHYVQKHRPAVGLQIVGWETVNRPTEGALVAFAKKFFVKHDRTGGTRSIQGSPPK